MRSSKNSRGQFQFPIGCSVPLSGDLGQYRSFHHDDYRAIYQVFEDLKAIAVVDVGRKDAYHHAEIYKQLETLAGGENLRLPF